MPIGEKKMDKKNKTILLMGILIFLLIGLVVVLILIFVVPKPKGDTSSSSSLSSSSEISSSTSEVDTYIDDVIDNINTYTSLIHQTYYASDISVKDIYSFNIYESGGTTHICYTYTVNNVVNTVYRIHIDTSADINNNEVMDLIHDDGLVLTMFVGRYAYDIVNSDITSKAIFTSEYIGDYTHHICYTDEYDEYHLSGIGKNNNTYTSIDHLYFDNDHIDNSDAHVLSVNDNSRYQELLMRII